MELSNLKEKRASAAETLEKAQLRMNNELQRMKQVEDDVRTLIA
jgi:hypothetical protein